MTPIGPHIGAFLQERLPVDLGASENTLATYAHAFRLLFGFASRRRRVSPSDLQVEHLDAPLVLAFLEHLERDRGNSPSSRNARLAAIKSFMRFIEHRVPSALEQVGRVLAIPAKKTDEPLVAHLSLEEMRAVLDSPTPRTRFGIRDRAMLHVCYGAALRVSELVGLRLVDVLLQPRASIRVLGKGRRERVMPLSKDAAHAVRAWLAVRGEGRVPELFLNARGQNLSRSGFEYVLEKHVRHAQQRCHSLSKKRISPHVLRHTCAMVTLQATHDLRRVALWLGHASTQTTEIYTRADPTEKLEALAAVTPPGLRRGRFKPPDRVMALFNPPFIMRSRLSSPSRESRPKRSRGSA
jgi:integrase/recombinase XerD